MTATQWFRKHFEESGLTQAEVSRQTGITRDLICRYNNGSREPSIRQLVKLAKFFHADLNELLEEDN